MDFITLTVLINEEYISAIYGMQAEWWSSQICDMHVATNRKDKEVYKKKGWPFPSRGIWRNIKNMVINQEPSKSTLFIFIFFQKYGLQP